MERKTLWWSVAASMLCLLALPPVLPATVSARGGAQGVPYRPMTAEELLATLKADRSTILIDCRPIGEYRTGHIPGAKNVSIDSLSFGRETVMKKAIEGIWSLIVARLPLILVDGESNEEYMPRSKLTELIAQLPNDKNREIVFSCRRPECTRSPMAARWAAALGYTNIRRYEGGWKEWSEKGLPVEKGTADRP